MASVASHASVRGTVRRRRVHRGRCDSYGRHTQWRRPYAAAAASIANATTSSSSLVEKEFMFEGYRTRYVEALPPANVEVVGSAVLVHGFGGNAEHWRKNMPALAAAGIRSFAIDLLGYGYSEKPPPDVQEPNTIYNMEKWASQILSFVDDVASLPTTCTSSSEDSDAARVPDARNDVFLVCNSIGGVAGLQAAKDDELRPEAERRIKGVTLLNVSLRMLHVKKTPAWQRPLVRSLQSFLRTTPVGEFFFKTIATPEGVRNVLREAYNKPQTVDDTLVDNILKPGLEEGAVRVFLDFISYSGGPLPEELLAEVNLPVSILWGEKDPWEPLEVAQAELKNFPCVESFTVIPESGHCPMDEDPELVNPELVQFITSNAADAPSIRC